jgi:hypothetical protein
MRAAAAVQDADRADFRVDSRQPRAVFHEGRKNFV